MKRFGTSYKPLRSDSVELDSDVELLRFESPLPRTAKLIFGPSSSVSNTLADVTGVRYRFRLPKQINFMNSTEFYFFHPKDVIVSYILETFDGAEIGNDIESSNSFKLTPQFVVDLMPFNRFASLALLCTCSFGEVRRLNENSAYSTSFSPDIVSSPNSLSSSELSLILFKMRVWPVLCKSSS